MLPTIQEVESVMRRLKQSEAFSFDRWEVVKVDREASDPVFAKVRAVLLECVHHPAVEFYVPGSDAYTSKSVGHLRFYAKDGSHLLEVALYTGIAVIEGHYYSVEGTELSDLIHKWN